MKKFRFSLQAVRFLRDREEQKAIEAFARASLTHQKNIKLLTSAEGEIDRARAELRDRTAAGISAVDLRQMQQHFLELDHRRKECERALAESLAVLGKASAQLSLARRNKEVVERYYENQKTKYLNAVRLEENKLLDELAVRQSMASPFRLDLERSRN